MIYDAVYGMSSCVVPCLIGLVIAAIFAFLIVMFAVYYLESSWRVAIAGGFVCAIFMTIIGAMEVNSIVDEFRSKMLANPEYQRILGDARALDAQAGKLLERAREIRKQIKEKKDGKRNNSVSGDAAKRHPCGDGALVGAGVRAILLDMRGQQDSSGRVGEAGLLPHRREDISTDVHPH